MNQPDLREQFFARGVEAFKRLTGSMKDVYVCPICERDFTHDAVVNRTLTIEHVPPESIGGTKMTLTCKTCNSTAGSEVDSEVQHRDDIMQLHKMMFQKVGSFSTRARLEIDGVELHVQFDVVEGEVKISVLKDINNPAKFQAQMEYLQGLQESGKLEEVVLRLTPRIRFHIWRSQVSDLRSAYLAGFAGFGYTWAMHHALDPIREQIRSPDKHIVEHAWILRPRGFPPQNLIRGLREPAEGLAVFVGMTVVLLPWFTSPTDFYQRVGQSFTPERKLSIEGELLGWPEGMEMVVDFSL
jgi:hypothetical protein